jgi:hypothetical protein
VFFAVLTRVSPLFLLNGEFLWVLSAFGIPAASFFFSAWRYLAYRRSLESDPTWIGRAEPPVGEDLRIVESDSTFLSGTEIRVDPTLIPTGAYCPSCGLFDQNSPRFCRGCGFSLEFEPRGLEKYLPSFIIQGLDRTIAANDQFRATAKSKRSLYLTPLVTIVAAVLCVIAGNFPLASLAIFVGLSGFILTGWNILADRRAELNSGAVSSNLDMSVGGVVDRDAKQLDASTALLVAQDLRTTRSESDALTSIILEDTTKRLKILPQLVQDEQTAGTNELD